MIQTNYDAEADVLHVKFGPKSAKYDGSQEVAPGVYVEFDTEDNPIAVEIPASDCATPLRPPQRRERQSRR